MRQRARVGLMIVGGALVAACGGPAQPATSPDAPPSAPAAAPQAAGAAEAAGTLAAPPSAQQAFTYNPDLAPPGARLAVTANASGGNTSVRLEATGLRPNRGYAAHVHQRPCGPTGADAGPHHQHSVDPAATPEKASTDPAYANPRNEIWLDLRTDASGNAVVTSEVPFVFGADRPASVIVHEGERTATEPGKAGTAGARIACLSVPFSGPA